MLWWTVILISVPSSYGQIREIEYECGAHGRFEYCIDGIPGCVIGCHCHPGYYFDTDTKICEPNIRLTQNYRRNFDIYEPTRVQELPPTTQPVLEEPATTVSNAVDEKIDIIAKDADDLGDWLYNQFFKTIENQVINKTEGESSPARRSGSSPTFLKKPSRRSHKYWKAKKRRKKKRKGLKGKLLRITEDDSLFDSSASSDSDESSDSGSSSSSSDTSDDTKERKKDNDHGHKKIVVFNKRPKPPLPSFIFLPNMETPFFPPIGLPPPPMPMYPMVPVPPMMPFPCSDQTTIAMSTPGSTATNPITTTTITTISTTAVTETNIEEENIPTEIGEVTPDLPNVLRSHQKMRGKPRQKLMKKMRDNLKRKSKLQNYFANEYQEPELLPDDEAPSECIPSLESNRHKPIPKLNMGEELRGLQDVDFKYISQLIHRADLNKTDHSSPTPTQLPKNNLTLPMPVRRNYFNTNDISQIISNLASQPVNHIPNLPQQTNTYNVKTNQQAAANPHRKKIEDTNDLYYANLGRQIASMIRNIDADKEIDIEIEKSSAKPQTNSLFTGNSYGSRSYWERSVRSPLKYLMNSFKREMNFLKKSNENLYSLENKVEIAASTEPPLSLHELENIISKMEKAKSKLIRKSDNINHTKSSKSSFNVNLLPGNAQSFQCNEKADEEPRNIEPSYHLYNKNANTQIKNIQLPLQAGFEISYKNNNAITSRENAAQSLTQPEFEHTHDNNDKVRKQISQIKNSYNNNANIERHNAQSPIVPELDKSLLTSFRRILPDANYHRNGTALEKNIFPNIPPARKQYKIVESPHYKLKSNNFKLYAYTVLPLPLKQPLLPPFMQVTTIKPLYHQIKPITIKKGANYYSGNNNNPLFEKAPPSASLTDPKFSNNFDPFQFVQPFRREVAAPVPYFHHGLHNFDYFDDLS